jgi:hypothetical protein
VSPIGTAFPQQGNDCLARKIGLSAAIVACVMAVLAMPVTAASKSFTLNNNTLGIMAGEPQWLPVVRTLARDLNHKQGLRLLPVLGEGSVQAVSDVLRLDGIDAALIPSDSIHYANTQGLLGKDSGKVTFLARLGTLKLALVTRKSTTSLQELEGKRIATGPAQSAGFAAGEWIFGSHGISFVRVAASGADALNSLVRKEADAALVMGTDDLRRMPNPENYHVLSIPMTENLQEIYAPALLSADEQGAIGADTQPIETVSAALVLAVFNWDERNAHSDALGRLAEALLESSQTSGKNNKPYNLAADVPGIARHVAAIRALDAAKVNLSKSVEGVTQ